MILEAAYCPVCKHLLEVIDGRKYCKLCHAIYYIQVEVYDVDSPLLQDKEEAVYIDGER